MKRLAPTFILFLHAGSVAAGESGLVINEVLHRSPEGTGNGEFVELFYGGEAALDLSGWSLSGGIHYVFPEGTRMGPASFLVVCGDLPAFARAHGPDIKALGNFSGRLGRKEDRVELLDREQKLLDSVKYESGGEWPLGPMSGVSSLERICPSAPSRLPANWAPSPPAAPGRSVGTPGRRNDSFAASLPPVVSRVELSPKCPAPTQAVTVQASVSSFPGVRSVSLLHRVAGAGEEAKEEETPMARLSGDDRAGTYSTAVAGKPDRTLVRFRIKAVDAIGVTRMDPPENEPRFTYSYYVFANAEKATIPVGFVLAAAAPGSRPGAAPPRRGWSFFGARRFGAAPAAAQPGTFVYVPPGGKEYETFDHVRISPRNGGFKVRFRQDQTLRGMSVANLIFEGEPRFSLAEPLAYELYRMAGVAAPHAEHVRVWMNGRLLGYHLLVEQPNRSFLARNGRDDRGNLYKLLWYGQGIVGQHEKKTNVSGGHEDLLGLIQGLRSRKDEDRWDFIRESFRVEEVAGYFAVNMCISNWDGFFNNYFAYHDVKGTGKWEIIPWDEDKTWGDYDGASPDRDWHDMPLTFGMEGDQPEGGRGRGPFGGGGWWRPPGYFSGPLLANAGFRQVFLRRLKRLCEETFTEEKLFPVIDALEKRLEPEIEVRAQAAGEDPELARQTFRRDISSFRAQVTQRRRFLLAQLKV